MNEMNKTRRRVTLIVFASLVSALPSLAIVLNFNAMLTDFFVVVSPLFWIAAARGSIEIDGFWRNSWWLLLTGALVLWPAFLWGWLQLSFKLGTYAR